MLATWGVLGEWAWEPWVVAPLVASVAVYWLGVRGASAHGRRSGVRPRHVAAFLAGCLIVAVALLSPIDAVSEQLFWVHMVQHELLMVAAAPLLVLGRPMIVMLWAFPLRMRQRLGHAVRVPAVRAVWHAASRPFDAWLIHGLAIWCWHLPVLFQAALRNEAIHALQHASFLGSGLLFWWAIFNPRRRSTLGLSVIYLFTTAVHTAVLGALMTFARAPWYPAYGVGPAAWGMTPLEDQQLAGLVMWVPAGVAYLVAALVVMRRWLSESEWSVSQGEHMGERAVIVP